MTDIRTPGFQSLSREAFAARVWQLIPEAMGGRPAPLFTAAQEAAIWELIDVAREYETGPFDTACEIVDRIWRGEEI